MNEPDVLRVNGALWRDAVIEKYARGERPSKHELARYRHPDIKAALIDETHGKCAYCESKLLHIHHGDVEHVFPKSLDRSKTFEWENLTLACEVCNQRKSDRDPNLEHIIDPYAVEPSEHLFFYGSLPVSRGTAQGRATIAILDLGRAALVEQRHLHLDRLTKLVEQILDQGSPKVVRRALYDDFVTNEVVPSKPYTAMARFVLSTLQSQLEASFFD